MKNLKKLVKQLEKQAKSKWAIKEDMVDMYKQDAFDTELILISIIANKPEIAAKALKSMDSLPRDNAVMAIIEDKGNDWSAENLGWSMN